MSSDPTTTRKRERRWLRQHMGYLRSAVTRELEVISKRMSALEDLLGPVRVDPGLPGEDASSSLEHAVPEGNPGFCIACKNLLDQGRDTTVVDAIHALHVG